MQHQFSEWVSEWAKGNESMCRTTSKISIESSRWQISKLLFSFVPLAVTALFALCTLYGLTSHTHPLYVHSHSVKAQTVKICASPRAPNISLYLCEGSRCSTYSSNIVRAHVNVLCCCWKYKINSVIHNYNVFRRWNLYISQFMWCIGDTAKCIVYDSTLFLCVLSLHTTYYIYRRERGTGI